jgi:endonuclease-3 related protein
MPAKMVRIPTPDLRLELLGIKGIGPETCDSILLYAFNRPVFVVDSYTKRIFSRHGFFAADASYEKAQALFTANLPSDEHIYNEYHALIVRLAKERCRVRPRCEDCPLKGVKNVAKDTKR